MRSNSVCDDSLSTGAWSIQPKFPQISVQNSMDRFGPTRKVSKKQNVDHFSRSDQSDWKMTIPFKRSDSFLFPVPHCSLHPGSVYPAVMRGYGCNITSLFREDNMFSVLISCFNCVSHDGNLGWLLFTQTTRMEIFYINIKLQNLTRWENVPLQSSIQISWTD